MPLGLTLLSATLPLSAGGLVQLLPFGEFAARDGRPGPGRSWRLDNVRGVQLAADMNTVAALTPIVVDYDHQTLWAPFTGAKAPAAGWIRGGSVEWRANEGLFARVDWTAAAAKLISDQEYRFISPVIEADDETGEIVAVHMAALVNHPALLGMDAVESAEALSAALAAALPRIRTTSHQEPAPMTTQNIALAALATALGLTAAATEAEALSTIAALKAKAEKADKPELPNDVASALGVKTSAEALSAITALKTAQTGLDGAMTQITALQGQVQALTQRQTEGDLVALADGAIAEGKFVPALREQLLSIGRKDVAALQAMIKAAPAIPGLAGQATAQAEAAARTAAGGTQTAALSSTEALAVARNMGISPDAWAKSVAAAAAAA